MRDLTEQLSTDIARAVNKFRDATEEAQRTIAAAQMEMTAEIQAGHQAFEVAAGLRMEAAHRDMAAQFTAFLGQPKLQERLPDVADGPMVAMHVEDYSHPPVSLITDHGFDNGEAVR